MNEIINSNMYDIREEQKIAEPFVNEECGDAMWDQVLEETEMKPALKDAALTFSF